MRMVIIYYICLCSYNILLYLFNEEVLPGNFQKEKLYANMLFCYIIIIHTHKFSYRRRRVISSYIKQKHTAGCCWLCLYTKILYFIIK